MSISTSCEKAKTWDDLADCISLIIELYGERWHWPEEEQQRIDLFARSDYHVLVVWQRELRPKPDDRKRLYQRLRDFEKLDDISRTVP